MMLPLPVELPSGQPRCPMMQAIRQAMSEPISLDLQGVPLTEAIQSVAEKHHLEYLFDGGALKDAGIDPSTTLVTAAMKGVTLRSALKWMLAPLA